MNPRSSSPGSAVRRRGRTWRGRSSPSPLRRIGWLLTSMDDHPEGQARFTAFHEGLAALGWIEGRNMRIEYSLGEPYDTARVQAYAAELVNAQSRRHHGRRQPGPDCRCWRQTRTIPTVFVATVREPWNTVSLRTLRDPAGNATGFTLFDEFSLAGKLVGNCSRR